MDKDLSRQTVSRHLREVELKAHTAVSKPLISRKNKKARQTYAEERVVWTEENWSKVHFSDESKFHLFGSDAVFILSKTPKNYSSTNLFSVTKTKAKTNIWL